MAHFNRNILGPTTINFTFALNYFTPYKHNITMISYVLIDPSSKVIYMEGPYQLLVILAVVMLLFGGKKIPEMMKGLGEGIKGFKDGMKEGEDNSKHEPPADKN